MACNDTMPGDREGDAAVRWMQQDHYGRPLVEGHRVTYRLKGWGGESSESGRILFVTKWGIAVAVEDDDDRGLLRVVKHHQILPL